MLRNVVAIVSGGSSGLGAATSAYIVRHGGRVVVADLPSSKDNFLRLAASTCAEVHHHLPSSSSSTSGGSSSSSKESNVGYHYYPHEENDHNYQRHHQGAKGWWSEPLMAFAETDVRNEEDVKQALDLAEEKFDQPVNVAISCAGICPARRTLSSTNIASNQLLSSPSSTQESEIFRIHSLEEFNTTLQINTTGTFNLARLSAERMALRKPDVQGMRGCIINTASIAAFEGQTGQVAYSASKGAVVGMTLPLARDLAKYGIRVMTIAPGLFKTPLLDGLPQSVQHELSNIVPCPNRLGDPDEFGRLVGSILLNPMLNGEVIRLDGALRMPP